MKISICIPTYNRARLLMNCLNSIYQCHIDSGLKFQVCISDNNSDDGTDEIIHEFFKKIDLKYNKNLNNIGMARNFLKVVSMADGDFIWLIGDDDLILPDSIHRLNKILESNPDIDYVYGNSYHLRTDFLEMHPSPFDIKNLPEQMIPFSSFKNEGVMPFFNLIDPKVSFDFLGGIFLSIFRKSSWDQNAFILDENALKDCRTFSKFDNTFPHLKIFGKAFSKSQAYFNPNPLNVCVTGAREWANMSPLIMSVRLVEALKEYRNNGMSLRRYLICKNYALRNAVPDLVNIVMHKEDSGYSYINLFKLCIEYSIYPNFYLSPFYFIGRRFRNIFFG